MSEKKLTKKIKKLKVLKLPKGLRYFNFLYFFRLSKKIILIFPLTVVGLVFFYSLWYALGNSIGYNLPFRENSLTLEFYKNIFCQKDFKNFFFYTVKLTILASGSSLLFSIFLIFIFYLNIKNKLIKSKIFKQIIELPIIVSYLVASYMILSLFSQRGIFSELFLFLGIIKNYNEFPILTNDKNGIGMILTYIWKSSAFIVAMSIPQVIKIHQKWSDLIKVFNLSYWNFYKEVILPLIFPTLLTSFIIVFSFIFTSFETPYILGITYPKTLAVYSYELSVQGGLEKRGELMALNIIITLITLLLAGVGYLVANKVLNSKSERWGK
ncbi:MAG: ABC transporter permease subunit [Fusobacteriaceae bacterium]